MISPAMARAVRGGPRSWVAESLGLYTSGRMWAAAAYLLLSFFVGLFWFIALVTLISLGFGLVVTLVGVPILLATMVAWTWGARAERWRTELMLGVRLRAPYQELPRPWRARTVAFIKDPAVWRDLAYLLVLFPVGILEFTAVLALLALPFWLVTAPLVVLFGNGGGSDGPPVPVAIVMVALWAPAVLALPWAILGMARLHGNIAQGLLGASREEALELRVDELTESRSRAVDAALTERRRIERDLHDGAQQRLVALAMNLGMAKIKFESDPARARELVEAAHEEAKQAMTEIRNLVRGIYPAVLTDRGLDAAISALAGRCPVPVTVSIELDERPPEAVESTAYFIVAEALTNVAKHSVATRAEVRVYRELDRLIVEVFDDGVGGAVSRGVSGLTGLADRAAGLDGRLTVQSPVGGPTLVRAELPWEAWGEVMSAEG